MRAEVMIDTCKEKYEDNNNVRSGSTRMCKGICVNYKAKKPANGKSRYAEDQARCQICSIYITSQGINDNRLCKCCNYKVRTKPRNRIYKEKIRMSESIINQEHTNKNLIKSVENLEQNKDDKKETPIYEKIDNSIKTYYEFKDFLNHTINLQTNHQLVVLKELLEYGTLHKGEIAESLAYFNNKDSSNIDNVKLFFNILIYDELLKRKIIIMKNVKTHPHIPCFSLNVKLTDNEKIAMLEYIVKQLEEYNHDHHIPDNEFPNANNMGSISWDDFNKNLIINYESNNAKSEEEECYE